MLTLQLNTNHKVIPNNEQHIVDAYKLRINSMNWQFSHYGLIEPWQFKVVDLPMNIVGKCVYTEKTVYINLYSLYLLDWNMIKYTMLHEIAHALTPNDNIKGSHDWQWQKQCQTMGIKPTVRLERNLILVDSANDIYKVDIQHPKQKTLLTDAFDDFPNLPW